jgi:NitT/TauT family transport system ATP-binding protein
MAGIEFSAIDFAFGRDAPLFHDFSITFPPERTIAVMGPSGCGKTTLLRLASGLLLPHKGQVFAGDQEQVRPGLIHGLVFHEDTLLPWLNMENNVCFHAPRDPETRAEARRLLTWLGLEDSRSRYPFELSAGMRKRAELARALVADKRFLLLDEPFSSLDLPTKLRLWADWSRHILQDGRTRIITTHDPFEAAAIADTVFVLTRTRPVRLHGTVDFQQERKPVEARATRVRALLFEAVESDSCIE